MLVVRHSVPLSVALRNGSDASLVLVFPSSPRHSFWLVHGSIKVFLSWFSFGPQRSLRQFLPMYVFLWSGRFRGSIVQEKAAPTQ